MIERLSSLVILLISMVSYCQNSYDLDEPLVALVRGKPFIYDGKDYDAKRVYNIMAGDSIRIKGVLRNTGRYLIDFKDCNDCAISTFFIEPNPVIENLITQTVEEIKKSEKLANEETKRKRDSLIKLRKVENRKQKIEEYKTICQYSQNNIDEFDGVLKTYTESYCVDNDPGEGFVGMCIQLRKIGNNEYVVFEHFIDLGCTSSYETNKSVVKVKLENNDILEFYHRGDIDCGTYRLFARLTPSDKARLKRSPISIIRLEGTDSFFDVKDIVYKDIFIDKLRCLD